MDYTREKLSRMSTEEFAQVRAPVFDSSVPFYDNLADVVNYEDLRAINTRINAAVHELYAVNAAYKQADDAGVTAQTLYDRAFRRYYLDLADVKPDGARRSRAKLKSEDLEDDVLYYTQQKSELSKIADGLRAELRSLEILSNNYRREMQLA